MCLKCLAVVLPENDNMVKYIIIDGAGVNAGVIGDLQRDTGSFLKVYRPESAIIVLGGIRKLIIPR